MLALQAEVLHCFHDAGAEILLPETIHRHPRGERMGGVEQPLRQAQAILRRVLGPRRKNRRDARLHFLAFLVVFTPQQQERISGLVGFFRNHGRRDLLLDRFAFLTPFCRFIEKFPEL